MSGKLYLPENVFISFFPLNSILVEFRTLFVGYFPS